MGIANIFCEMNFKSIELFAILYELEDFNLKEIYRQMLPINHTNHALPPQKRKILHGSTIDKVQIAVQLLSKWPVRMSWHLRIKEEGQVN